MIEVVGKDYGISILALYRLSDDEKSIEKIPNSGGTSPLGASDRAHKMSAQYAYS